MLQKQMHGHQQSKALILSAEKKKHEQKLTVFSVWLLYYEFTFDLNSEAKDDVEEMAGLSDPPPQDLKNTSMTGDINHRNLNIGMPTWEHSAPAKVLLMAVLRHTRRRRMILLLDMFYCCLFFSYSILCALLFKNSISEAFIH